MTKTKETSGAAVAEIIALVEPFDLPDRVRILRTVAAYFGEAATIPSSFRGAEAEMPSQSPPFSKETAVSPKQFMMEKKPVTDVERVACLAYYLTHHRTVEQFKTTDISKLNTEAAQVRFSNAAVAVDNAMKRGYLAHASKGYKQLSALGEQYVQALPDRDAAKTILGQVKARRRPRTKSGTARKKTTKSR